MAACRSSSKNIAKMSLIPVFNKKLPRAHTELEFNVLGVHRKLVKYVVHLSKRKKLKKKISYTSCPNSNQPVFGIKEIFLFTQAAQTSIDQFLFSRNFRI
jgi:hypothetical protein